MSGCWCDLWPVPGGEESPSCLFFIVVLVFASKMSTENLALHWRLEDPRGRPVRCVLEFRATWKAGSLQVRPCGAFSFFVATSKRLRWLSKACSTSEGCSICCTQGTGW